MDTYQSISSRLRALKGQGLGSDLSVNGIRVLGGTGAGCGRVVAVAGVGGGMVGPVGRRSPRMLALLLAAAVAVVAVSCGAAPRGVTGGGGHHHRSCPGESRLRGGRAIARSAARDQRVWIRQIMTAPPSGMVAIDAPMLDLAAALHGVVRHGPTRPSRTWCGRAPGLACGRCITEEAGWSRAAWLRERVGWL